jgi:hypothetical protein
MRNKIILSMLLVIMLLLMTGIFSAHAQEGNSVLIIPYLIPEDEDGNLIVEVPVDQTILLGARWGACNKGLAQAWAETASLMYSVDGQALFASENESRQYWQAPVIYPGGDPSRCLPHTETIWIAYWQYELGTLELGDHPAHLSYWNHGVPVDGGDYDGDGKPDKFKDWSMEVDFIIRVIGD